MSCNRRYHVFFREIASPNNLIPSNMSIFIYPGRFYASPTCIHIAIPDFSPTNIDLIGSACTFYEPKIKFWKKEF